MACRFLLWLCRISVGFTRCLVGRYVSQVWSYWLPMLMFIQEGPLLQSRRRAPASCENTIKEALVLISRILKVYLLKKKKMKLMDYAWAFPYCSSMGFDFQTYLQWPGTVLCVQASSETQSLSSKNTDCFIFSAFLFFGEVFWDYHLASENCTFTSEWLWFEMRLLSREIERWEVALVTD